MDYDGKYKHCCAVIPHEEAIVYQLPWACAATLIVQYDMGLFHYLYEKIRCAYHAGRRR